MAVLCVVGNAPHPVFYYSGGRDTNTMNRQAQFIRDDSPEALEKSVATFLDYIQQNYFIIDIQYSSCICNQGDSGVFLDYSVMIIYDDTLGS